MTVLNDKGISAEPYYESHITIEPVFGGNLEDVKLIAKKYNFRVAELLMKKRKEDTPERSEYDTFMTTRDKNFFSIRTRTIDCAEELRQSGFAVWRYKIEDCLEDIKYK